MLDCAPSEKKNKKNLKKLAYILSVVFFKQALKSWVFQFFLFYFHYSLKKPTSLPFDKTICLQSFVYMVSCLFTK